MARVTPAFIAQCKQQEKEKARLYSIENALNPLDNEIHAGDLFGEIVPYINRIYGIKSISGDLYQIVAECVNTRITITEVHDADRGF